MFFILPPLSKRYDTGCLGITPPRSMLGSVKRIRFFPFYPLSPRGSWCSGITPARHAGRPGLDPPTVHPFILSGIDVDVDVDVAVDVDVDVAVAVAVDVDVDVVDVDVVDVDVDVDVVDVDVDVVDVDVGRC